MKLLHYGQPLFAPVNDGGPGGGDGTGSPAAFDPAAFSAALMAEFAKANVAFAKTLKADLAKQFAAPAVAATPNPEQDPADGVAKPPSDPALAAQFKAMERQNRLLTEQFATMQKQSEATTAAAEVKERHSSIRDVLSGFAFGGDAQKDSAFRIFAGDIKRTADGSLVGGADEAPLKEYITTQMGNHAYLLAPRNVDGAGSRSGGRQAGVKAFDIDSIKPGMSAADLASASAEIHAALTGR